MSQRLKGSGVQKFRGSRVQRFKGSSNLFNAEPGTVNL
jgi:hypothetical protein